MLVYICQNFYWRWGSKKSWYPSEQELAALSNVSLDIDTGNISDTDSDIVSSDSDGDDGWETTEEVDGDAGHDDH